jgi:hypothetical protein
MSPVGLASGIFKRFAEVCQDPMVPFRGKQVTYAEQRSDRPVHGADHDQGANAAKVSELVLAGQRQGADERELHM